MYIEAAPPSKHALIIKVVVIWLFGCRPATSFWSGVGLAGFGAVQLGCVCLCACVLVRGVVCVLLLCAALCRDVLWPGVAQTTPDERRLATETGYISFSCAGFISLDIICIGIICIGIFCRSIDCLGTKY